MNESNSNGSSFSISFDKSITSPDPVNEVVEEHFRRLPSLVKIFSDSPTDRCTAATESENVRSPDCISPTKKFLDEIQEENDSAESELDVEV